MPRSGRRAQDEHSAEQQPADQCRWRSAEPREHSRYAHSVGICCMHRRWSRAGTHPVRHRPIPHSPPIRVAASSRTWSTCVHTRGYNQLVQGYAPLYGQERCSASAGWLQRRSSDGACEMTARSRAPTAKTLRRASYPHEARGARNSSPSSAQRRVTSRRERLPASPR